MLVMFPKKCFSLNLGLLITFWVRSLPAAMRRTKNTTPRFSTTTIFTTNSCENSLNGKRRESRTRCFSGKSGCRSRRCETRSRKRSTLGPAKAERRGSTSTPSWSISWHPFTASQCLVMKQKRNCLNRFLASRLNKKMLGFSC